ncbi:uncharacterized protein [Arachis hypogaea]|uniref:uncharacterized protein n=1 Tax=Arachis hypogaea TaxID=3818 RepID=UPI000DEDA8AB|nr:uncharacterized protein LOC112786517 [Arachis hypogaea]
MQNKRITYTFKFNQSQLIDLIDTDSVNQLITFNDDTAHVYIMEVEKTNHDIAPHEDNDDNVHDSTLSSNSTQGDVVTNIDGQNSLTPILCTTQLVPTPQIINGSAKWNDLIKEEGQIFQNASKLRKALFEYGIAHKFTYKFLKNSPGKIICVCKVEGCPWKLSAYAMGKNISFLVVRHFIKNHKHSAQDVLESTHSFRSNLVSSIIVDKLRLTPDKLPNDIRNDIFKEYGFSLTYHQAWAAKEKALAEINGVPKDSYMLIPWICNRLVKTDPQTVAKWTCSPSYQFEKLFVAYGCCVTGFLRGARPILFIDGCHLSGPYKGTLLAASTCDANNDLFPIAYAIVSAENNENWLWFLSNLKELTGSIPVTLIYDRHPSIIAAVEQVYDRDRHAYCYRHVKENFCAETKKLQRGIRGEVKEDAKKLLDAVCYTHFGTEFTEAVEQLRAFSPELANWLETKGDINKWAKSQFPHRRWDLITTNVAESFNSWIRKERTHSICALITEHRDKLANLLYTAKLEMTKWKNEVGPKIDKILMEHVARSEFLKAVRYGDHNVMVRGSNVDVCVNLLRKECTCLEWQMTGIPCPHACAAIKLLHGNIYTYVEECYLKSSQEKIYVSSMIPIETHDMPDVNNLTLTDWENNIFLMPPTTTRPPGRPCKKGRESQFQDVHVYKCSRCDQSGHNRSKCRNPNPEKI